jgi:hypothetical protein
MLVQNLQMLGFLRSYCLVRLQILGPSHRNQLQVADIPELRRIMDLACVGLPEEMLVSRQHYICLHWINDLVSNYLPGCCFLDLTSRSPLRDEFLPELLGLSGASCVLDLDNSKYQPLQGQTLGVEIHVFGPRYQTTFCTPDQSY